MGCDSRVSYDRFPQQGSHLGQRCEVTFHYKPECVMGTCVRDDIEGPNRTFIRLDDGRYVEGSECQYRPVGPAAQVSSDTRPKGEP